MTCNPDCTCCLSNLKEETLNVLSLFDLTAEDVLWVGGADFTIPTEEFWSLADTDYSDTFGNQLVATDLIVVCNGGYLFRNEHDGAEWWSFVPFPAKPEKKISVTSLIAGADTDGYLTLAEINGIEPEPEAPGPEEPEDTNTDEPEG